MRMLDRAARMRERRELCCFAGALLLGVCLRLVWLEDIEFKADEHYMMLRALHAGKDEPWPWLGMPSSITLRNPGLSIWTFVALARIGAVTTPVGLSRAVAILDSLAALLFGAFAFRIVREPSERRIWLYALALAAANPYLILMQRKIWAQSVMPIFLVAFFAGWWRKDRAWSGAFAWGLFGALLGQVHMAGFFFALAVAAGTFLVREERSRVRWGPWAAGTLAGAVPLVPWLVHVATFRPTLSSIEWQRILHFEFFTHWVSEPSAATLADSLGGDFGAFLRSPTVAGTTTYLVGVLHLVLLGISAAVVGRLGVYWWCRRRNLASLFVAHDTGTDLVLTSTLLGAGGAMTALGLSVWRHHLLAMFPLPYLWGARAALRARGGDKLLFALIAASFAVSIAALAFLHVHGGAEHGDYGRAYSAQPPFEPTAPSEAPGAP
jgi:hypothetical protein